MKKLWDRLWVASAETPEHTESCRRQNTHVMFHEPPTFPRCRMWNGFWTLTGWLTWNVSESLVQFDPFMLKWIPVGSMTSAGGRGQSFHRKDPFMLNRRFVFQLRPSGTETLRWSWLDTNQRSVRWCFCDVLIFSDLENKQMLETLSWMVFVC